MGSPYLNRGESITLTTHRVTVESVPYDMMLTTHRLTLIDSRYARFEPLMIAFEDIITVKSGSASTGEPVIILTYTGADDGVEIMNIIFSQQPAEHRKHERDLWVKKLMEAIIAGREGPQTGEGEGTIEERPPARAATKRWTAPEGVTIHTPFSENEPAQPEITITTEDEISPEEPGAIAGKNRQHEPLSAGAAPATSRATTEYDYGIRESENDESPARSPQEEPDPLTKFQTIRVPFVPAEPHEEKFPGPGSSQEPATPAISMDAVLAGAKSLVPEKPLGQDAPANAGEPDGQQVRYEQPGPHEEKAREGTDLPALPADGDGMQQHGESPAGSEHDPVDHPGITPDRTPPGAGSPPPAGSRGIIRILLAIIALLVVAAAIVVLVNIPAGSGSTNVVAVVTPAANETPAAPLVLSIPASGAGFRIMYDGNYAGYIGSPGRMKGISGSGDTFYPVLKANDLVQASIQKQDNSGNTLTIQVYNNGKMIYARNVSTPAGQLDILVDTGTGSLAGMKPDTAATTTATQARPLYF